MSANLRLCLHHERSGRECRQPALRISNYCRHHHSYHIDPVSILPTTAIPRFSSLRQILQIQLDMHKDVVAGRLDENAFARAIQLIERALPLMNTTPSASNPATHYRDKFAGLI